MRRFRISPLFLAVLIMISPVLLAESPSKVTYYYSRNAVASLGAGAAVGGLAAHYLEWYWGLAMTSWCGWQMLAWTAIWVTASL